MFRSKSVRSLAAKLARSPKDGASEIGAHTGRAGVAAPYVAYAAFIAACAGVVLWRAGRPERFPTPGASTDLLPEFVEVAALLGLIAAATAWFAVATRDRAAPVGPLLERLSTRPARTLAWIAAATLAACLLIAGLVLDGFPNSGDEQSNAFQAETYAVGRLWMPAPPLPEFFAQWRVPIHEGKWVGQYPPGWSAMLAIPLLVGLPMWIVNPLLALATVYAFHALARRYVAAGTALLALLALVTSAFFLFTYASFFNHALVALAALIFALLGRRLLDRPTWAAALALGAIPGFVGLSRPFSVVLLVLPFAVQLLATRSWPHLRTIPWMVAGGLPFLALLLLFNAAVTGDPALFIPNWVGDEPERFAWPDWLARWLMKWRIWQLLVWTSPLLLAAAVPAFLALLRRRRLDFTDFYMPLVVVGFIFYPPSGGNQYGPRYWFDAYPFLLLTVAKAIDPWVAGRELRLRRVVLHLAAAHLIIQTVVLPFRIAREHRVVTERQDPYRLVAEQGLTDAVVLIGAHTGLVRTMAPRDLARNGISLDRPVIYAMHLPGREAEIRAAFPGRRFHLYTRELREAEGRLTALP